MQSEALELMAVVLVAAAMSFWAGFEMGRAVRPEPEPMPCTAGPGEISHMDERGLCAVTLKGRVVTRYQT